MDNTCSLQWSISNSFGSSVGNFVTIANFGEAKSTEDHSFKTLGIGDLGHLTIQGWMEGAVWNYGYPGYPYISLFVGKPRSYEFSWKLNQKDPKGGFCGSIWQLHRLHSFFKIMRVFWLGFPRAKRPGLRVFLIKSNSDDLKKLIALVKAGDLARLGHGDFTTRRFHYTRYPGLSEIYSNLWQFEWGNRFSHFFSTMRF